MYSRNLYFSRDASLCSTCTHYTVHILNEFTRVFYLPYMSEDRTHKTFPCIRHWLQQRKPVDFQPSVGQTRDVGRFESIRAGNPRYFHKQSISDAGRCAHYEQPKTQKDQPLRKNRRNARIVGTRPTHGAEQIYILFNSVFYDVLKGETYFAGPYDSRRQHTWRVRTRTNDGVFFIM